MIKILVGGSPCTFWSIAQKNSRETEAEGLGWELFKNYLIAKEKFKPDFFLYENNKSAAQPIKDQISHELGVELMYINSALVSAQNRQRFYAFNWTVDQPEDRGILLKDILESGVAFTDKSYALTTRCCGAIPEDTLKRHRHTMIAENVGEALTIQRAIPGIVDKYGHLPEMFNAYNKAEITEKSPTLSTGSMVTSSCAVTKLERVEGAEPYAVGDGIPVNETADGKAQCLRASSWRDGIRNMVGNEVDRRTCVAHPVKVGEVGNGGQGNRVYSTEGKTVAITASSGGIGSNTGLYACQTEVSDAEGIRAIKTSDGKTHTVYKVADGEIEIKGKKYPIKLPDGYYIIRKLTPIECERLQTLPDGYTAAVSNSQRYKGLGNGWTAEVIIHILMGALKDVPRDEEIVVLSMYDGIGTGRYCLDKMGFTNVTYYAYEIDKPAMTVALSNYPDIIQLGDAFDLRRDDWELGKRFEHTAEQKAEAPESHEQTTDLSDAPEEIKEQIIENDRALKEKDDAAPTPLPEGFDVVDQLYELLAERKKLHIIDEENLRYNCDIVALEYAIGALRR